MGGLNTVLSLNRKQFKKRPMNGATTTARLGWVLLILAASPAAGVLTDRDQGTSGPAILKMETGARAAGMAGTFVAVADDASGIFWNPACLNQTERQEFLLSHSQEFGNQRYSAAAYTRPFWSGHRRRTLGVGVATLSSGSFDVLTDGETTDRVNPYEAVAHSSGQCTKQRSEDLVRSLKAQTLHGPVVDPIFNGLNLFVR